MEKIIINDIEFDCFETSKTGIYPEDYFYTVVDINTFTIMKPILDEINHIMAYTINGLLKYDTTEYGSYAAISYQDKSMWGYEINGERVDTFRISFKRIDLEQKINQISNIVLNTIDETRMSLEQFKEYWKEKLSEQCKQIIYNGTDIETSYGLEHFTFNSEDQKDLMTYFIASFMTKLPQYYHPSTNPPTSCRPYSYQEIVTIYLTLNMHLLYHMTYANQLYIKLYNCKTKEEVKNIIYGMPLDEEAMNVVNGAVNSCQDTISALQQIFASGGVLNV